MFKLIKICSITLSVLFVLFLGIYNKNLLIMYTFNGFTFLNQAIFDQGYISLNNFYKLNNKAWFFTGKSKISNFIFIFGTIILAYIFSYYLAKNLNFHNSLLDYLYPLTSIISSIILTAFIRWKYVTRRVKKYKIAYLIGEFAPPLKRFLLIAIFYFLSKIFRFNTNSEINHFVILFYSIFHIFRV